MTIERLFTRRLVDQVCPSCSLREAAGVCCSACLTLTGLADYIAARVVEEGGVVLARRNAPLAPLLPAPDA